MSAGVDEAGSGRSGEATPGAAGGRNMQSRERRLSDEPWVPGDMRPHLVAVLLKEPERQGGRSEWRANGHRSQPKFGSLAWAIARASWRTGGVLRVDGGLEERDVSNLKRGERVRKAHRLERGGRFPADRLSQVASREALECQVGKGEEKKEALEEVEVLAVTPLEEAALARCEGPALGCVWEEGELMCTHLGGARCRRVVGVGGSGEASEEEGGRHGGVLDPCIGGVGRGRGGGLQNGLVRGQRVGEHRHGVRFGLRAAKPYPPVQVGEISERAAAFHGS